MNSRPDGPHLLAERQQGGDDGDRRVAAHGEVDVVVVERVAGGAVDQGGGGRQDLLGAADQGRRSLGAVLERLADQDVGQFLLRPGNGDGEPVEQALLGALDQVVGQVAPGESGGAAGDFGGDGNGGHAASCDDAAKVSATGRRLVYVRGRRNMHASSEVQSLLGRGEFPVFPVFRLTVFAVPAASAGCPMPVMAEALVRTVLSSIVK